MSRLPQVANAHRKSYVSDLSDAEWELLASWLPAPKGFGRPRTVDLQEIMNGVFYGNGHTIADISATFTPDCARKPLS